MCDMSSVRKCQALQKLNAPKERDRENVKKCKTKKKHIKMFLKKKNIICKHAFSQTEHTKTVCLSPVRGKSGENPYLKKIYMNVITR